MYDFQMKDLTHYLANSGTGKHLSEIKENVMQAAGIIVEYNPFHNGHKWHLEKTRQLSGCSLVIGVMSGNFVQRGEPAIFDKWTRAEMAVRAGVDLVFELPTVFAVRSAQYFAEGGIRLLNSLGIVSHICFGAENADLVSLSEAARLFSGKETMNNLKSKLKEGATYAAALANAITSSSHLSGSLLIGPNNILAIEYLRAINKYAPQLTPIAIKRHKAHHNDRDITSDIASASTIRNMLCASGKIDVGSSLEAVLPTSSVDIINVKLAQGQGPVTWSSLSDILIAKLRSAELLFLAQLPDAAEGLHQRIKAFATNTPTVEDFFSKVKTKRYLRTRIQRIAVHALLGTVQSQLTEFDQSGPLYAKILAFNQRGRAALSIMNGSARIPLITKTAKYLTSKQQNSRNLTALQKMLAVDALASDIYVLGMPKSCWKSGGQDFLRSPVHIP